MIPREWSMPWCFFVLPLFVFLLGPFAQGASEKNLPPNSLDEVRQGLAARNAAFRNARFRVTYQVHRRRNLYQGNPFENLTQAMDVLLDADNQARVDMLVSQDPSTTLPGSASDFRMIANVTKTESRELGPGIQESGKQKKQILMGLIHEPQGLTWAAQPAQLLSLGPWSPAGYLQLAQYETSLTGNQTIDGIKTLRLEWKTVTGGPDPDEFHGTLWLAPEMDYAVVRSNRLMRPNPSLPWREVERTESTGWKEVEGLWLPEGVKSVTHLYGDNIDYQMILSVIAQFEGWKINLPLTEESFAVDFPDGTVVQDNKRGGITYIKGQINDSQIKRQVNQARKLTSLPPPDPGLAKRLEVALLERPVAYHRDLAWVAGLFCLVLIGLIALVVVKRRFAMSAGRSDR